MFIFIVVLGGLVLLALLLLARRTKGESDSRDQLIESHEFDESQQMALASAEHLAEVVSESIRNANQSKDVETKRARLNRAKENLASLKALAQDHPYIALYQPPHVEKAIASLEWECRKQMSQSRGCHSARRSLGKR